MAQFGRPVSTADNTGAWLNEAASAVNPHLSIDEASASDTDYVESPQAPVSDPITFALTTTLEDPVSSSGHIVRWRIGKDATGGATVNMIVELRQGYVSEASQGTLIATVRASAAVPDALTTESYTLAAGEADAITNYGSLYLRFVANQV